MICGHSAAVLDFEFNPFHDQIIASAGEDATIKVWGIPEDGVTTNISEPLVDLAGHSRKISLLRFHPTASNVLASVSSDPTVKLWDVETGAEMSTFSDMADQLCQEIVWDYCGNNFAVSNKDKAVRIVDARSCSIAQKIATAHEGAKSTKLVYLGDSGKLCSVGFTRQSQRQFKIWDPRNLTAEIKKVDIDQAAGVIMPFFDPDTNLLYLAGKGDGNVRFYEFVNENPHCFPISDFRSQTPAKGMAMVPKRGLNVMGCETSRLLKLTSNSVEPLSFSVPRKSDAFQDDLYPPTIAPESCHTAAEWLAGSSLPPKKMSLNPANKGAVVSGGAGSSAPKTFTAPKTAAQLQAELNAANAKLAKYEEKLKAAGISLD
jgi:coronin-1B/1C/6